MSDGAHGLLSIVVPVYNRDKIIVRTLDSIAAQQMVEQTRIVLVDNASTDDTLRVMNDWADNHPMLNVTILREEKRGASAARNCGLRQVTTPYVMFFDSDDEMLPGLLSRILHELEKGDVDIVGWPIRMELSDGHFKEGIFATENVLWNHLMHGFMSTLRFCASTSLCLRVGGWPDDLPTWDDLEFGLRLLLESPRVKRLPGGIGAIANFTDQSLTGRLFSEKAGTWERSLDRCASDLRRVGLSERWVDVRRAILAADYVREGRTDLSALIMKKLLDGKPMIDRLALKAVWLKRRIYPKGTTLFASLLWRRNLRP